jgi:hypothetical protein
MRVRMTRIKRGSADDSAMLEIDLLKVRLALNLR